MKVFVNCYNDNVFRSEEECKRDIERTFCENESFSEFVHECRNGLTEDIIAAIIHDNPNKDVLFAEIKKDYQCFLKDFINEYFMEMDEEELNDCSWFYGEIH